MDKKNFTAMVFRARPPRMSEDYLNKAIDYFINDLGQTNQSDVSHCIQLADRFAVSSASPQGDGGISGGRLKPLTPGMIVISNDLTRRITASVEQVRQELFGSTDVPFS